jgi:hypothetical protein
MLGLFVLGTLCGLLWALERWLDNPQVYPGGPVTQLQAIESHRRHRASRLDVADFFEFPSVEGVETRLV